MVLSNITTLWGVMSKQDLQLKKQAEENERLQRKIEKLEKTNKQLKTEKKTLIDIQQKTEEYLLSIADSKTMLQIFKELGFTQKQFCPHCNKKTLQAKSYGNVTLLICSSCEYRDRVHEERADKAT